MSTAANTIEDIILRGDARGISRLRVYLPANFCDEAAKLLLEQPGKVIIITGFYVNGYGETDGPPGAVALGNALTALGYEVVYATDRYSIPLLRGIAPATAEVIDFPVADEVAGRREAQTLLQKHRPSALVAIERCGPSFEGTYHRFSGADITEYTARLDLLFAEHPEKTIGIGDGGNEVGLGALAGAVRQIPTLAKVPTVAKAEQIVIATVSNWGAYGLVAALSRLQGHNLLPAVAEERAWVERLVALGAVAGSTGQPNTYEVDGFTLEENSAVMQALHDLLAAEGVR